MPLPNYTFSTQGSWETTNVTNMGQPIDCRAIYLHILSNNYVDGADGGDSEGWNVDEARIVVPSKPEYQDQIGAAVNENNLDKAFSLCDDIDIFPGTFSFYKTDPQNNNVTSLSISYNDSDDALTFTLDEVDCTDDVCELYCNIDSITNTVELWISLISNRRMFGRFDVITNTIF